MSQLVRFDRDHFGVLNTQITMEHAAGLNAIFERWWPGKKLIFFPVEEFVDVTGKYRLVELGQPEKGPRPVETEIAG